MPRVYSVALNLVLCSCHDETYTRVSFSGVEIWIIVLSDTRGYFISMTSLAFSIVPIVFAWNLRNLYPFLQSSNMSSAHTPKV